MGRIQVLASPYRHFGCDSVCGREDFDTLGSLFRPAFVFSHDFFATSPAVDWLGAILTVAGIALAIWARFYLGRNWSPQPSVKENHELVTGGPYAYVRHPIYTGMLLAALGTLLSGSIFGVIVLVVGSVVFTTRVYKEEKIMLELFPNEYAAYQKRTKHLIPFIW